MADNPTNNNSNKHHDRSSSNKDNNKDNNHQSRSSRGPRGLLRRYANVEHVIVEEPFRLYNRSGHGTMTTTTTSSSSHGRASSSHSNSNNNNNNKAGDGCYVSATVQNRRYYGVLVDQAALKTASELWFHNEAESLDLNRRMKQLYQQQKEQQEKEKEKEKTTETAHQKGEDQGTIKDYKTTFLSPSHGVGPGTEDKKRKAVSVAVAVAAVETATNTDKEDQSHHIHGLKRAKLGANDDKGETKSTPTTKPTKNPPTAIPSRPVQKFKYLPPVANTNKAATMTTTTASDDDDESIHHNNHNNNNNNKGPGYRVLLATYADLGAAVQDHPAPMRRAIEDACQSGGNFVGDFYYQYESVHSTLESTANTAASSSSSYHHTNDDGIRMSMGFESFLRETILPQWFPLSNLEGGGNQKVLSMLSMKRNHKGGLVWDQDPTSNSRILPDAASTSAGTHVPMTPRSKYRIGILGGGIAGLACAEELVRSFERDMIDVEVVLLEGRSRLGGRLWTDTDTFPTKDNNADASSTSRSFLPVDLGASWIHGIDDNPLAAVAREAGTHFVTVSDQVKMVGQGMQGIDKDCDERMGKVFDDILEQAADDCWAAEDNVSLSKRSQKAIRWYASALLQSKVARATPSSQESDSELLIPTDVPEHRYSSDITIDHAIGAEVAKRRRGQFAKLTKEDQRVLLWNTKSLESTLGANISDLSLKYWENDERHAFEGDHVVLKEGYSLVIQHMLGNLKRKGDRFKCMLNFEVGKVEYARKSTTQPYADRSGKQRKFIELSDTCCVTSQDASQSIMFDFLICTVPLGVLKECIATTSASVDQGAIAFQPPLPFSKVDSIRNVGFGLLNKLYLQFPTPFWRRSLELDDEEQVTFGNASGVKPQHYMFFDVGKALAPGSNAPAVLMTLLSGRDAVESELKSDDEILQSVMETLQSLFSNMQVPQPVATRFTRWGSDKFSRGSHTFLPPGATDQDFQILQSPINGNGDSLLLDGSETMRLFFAGEHTTALHPSTAHGALLSGIRAGKEVVNTIKLHFHDDKEVIDRLIPLALFRKINPEASLHCNMCQLVGTRVREGTLLAFKRGARQVLAHNNCAENSPEVGVTDGRWTHVIKAVNRGKVMTCSLCRTNGATIGCAFQNCYRVYHFSCGEDTGWRFDRDGKEFYCDLHRSHEEAEPNECDRISLTYCRSKVGAGKLRCVLCGEDEDFQRAGELLAFQRHKKRIMVHEKCARYTNNVDTSEATESRIDHEFRNVFEAFDLAKSCSTCGKNGATIGCSEPQCSTCLHFVCAEDSGWNFEKKGSIFKCAKHRGNERRLRRHDKSESNGDSPKAGGIFQHALFALGQDNRKARPQAVEKPANADIGAVFPAEQAKKSDVESEDESSESEAASNGSGDDSPDVMNLPIAAPKFNSNASPSSAKFTRPTFDATWNVVLSFSRPSASGPCVISFETTGGDDASSKGRVLSLNGVSLGSNDLATVQDVLAMLRKETAVNVEFLPNDVESTEVR